MVEPDGFPVNLIDKRVILGVKKDVSNNSYVFAVWCQVTDPVNGKCRASLTPAETKANLTEPLFTGREVKVELVGELVIVTGASPNTTQRTVIQFKVNMIREIVVNKTIK